MAQLPSVGTSAQILTHAQFDRPPVVQTPRRGRFPNSVINFWKAGGDLRQARYMAQQRLEEIEKTKLRIADHDWIANQCRIQLAQLTQTQGASHV